jgi:Ca2+-binding EF-hand superfamily protein
MSIFFSLDGCIYAKQMGELLRALGQNPTEADIAKFGYVNRPGTILYISQDTATIF